MSKSQHSRSAFTLVEILIVVVILSILAVIAVPKFSNASQIARESTLKDDLRFLRSQISVYRAQHNDTSPGYANGDTSATATQEVFVNQLTQPTNTDGVINGSGKTCGPYLSRMPDNPLNGKTSIKILAESDEWASDDSYGWLYKPGSCQIRAANPGLDSEQKSYLSY